MAAHRRAVGAGALPPWLLVLIAVGLSLTSILSVDRAAHALPAHRPAAPLGAGQRRRFERLRRRDDPRPADRRRSWRIAGGAVGALVIGGRVRAGGARAHRRPGPRDRGGRTGRLLRDALARPRYAWRNRRPCAGSASRSRSLNLAGGHDDDRRPAHGARTGSGAREALVGVVFAALGRRRDGLGARLRADGHPRARVGDARRAAVVYRAGRARCCPARRLPARRGARSACRDRPHRRLRRCSRARQRSARHRPVHGPPATDRPGLARAGVRGLDGLQLRRLPDRRGARRRPVAEDRSRRRSCRAIVALPSRPCPRRDLIPAGNDPAIAGAPLAD